MFRRIVEHRSGRRADVDYLATRCDQAFEQSVVKLVRTEAAIAAEIYFAARMANQISPQSQAELLNTGTGQIRIRNAANIVFAEDSGLQHKLRS